MTWKDRTIIIESVVIVLLIAACVGVWRFYYNPTLVFEWKGDVSGTNYSKDGDKNDKYFISPIWINGKQISDNTYRVFAGDDYKWASRDLGVKTSVYHHMPLVTYTALYNVEAEEFRHGLTGMYFYNFGPVALGGGASAVFSKAQLYDIGPAIGLAAFIK